MSILETNAADKSAGPTYPQSVEYKATGMQLRVPPDARGALFDAWLKGQSLTKPGEVQAWIKRQSEERTGRGAATKPKPSGALPVNTEWL